MSERHLLGVKQDGRGRIAPVFAPAGLEMDALSHHRAVVDALRQGPFVPAAYGNALAEHGGALAIRLKQRGEQLRQELARSTSTVEVGLAITFAQHLACGSERPSSGRGFLRAAAGALAATEEVKVSARALINRAADVDGVSGLRLLSETSTGLRAAFAVARVRAAGLVGVLEEAEIRDATMEVSGPWPLYSFGLGDILTPGRAE